jgi:predicted dehydrogenase
MKKVSVAVIGHGFLGKWHVQKALALHSICELKAIVEANTQQHVTLKNLYPHVKITAHLKEILDDIEAAIVVTPTSYHFSVCKELLVANKHVFCEKPLASTLEQSQDLALFAKKNHLLLQVGHSERCHAIWPEAKSWLASDTNHPSKALVTIKRYAPFKGRATDVDVVQDLMIHDIDLMLWIYGDAIEKIEAIGFRSLSSFWDHVEATFTFKNGTKVSIQSGRHHVEEVRELIHSDHRGTFKLDLFRNCGLSSFQSSQSTEVKALSWEKRDHLLVEQEAFYRSLLYNEPIFVSAQEGCRAVDLVEKVLKSLSHG